MRVALCLLESPYPINKGAAYSTLLAESLQPGKQSIIHILLAPLHVCRLQVEALKLM
jgi:hypothetical protein